MAVKLSSKPKPESETKSPINALSGKYADTDLLADLEEEHRQELQEDMPFVLDASGDQVQIEPLKRRR